MTSPVLERRDDGELKRLGGDTLTRSQVGHEFGHLCEWEGGVMLDFGDSLTGWEYLVKMTAPARRIVTCR